MSAHGTTQRACARTGRDLADALDDVIAALPVGMTFLEWYSSCDMRDFVGTRAVKASARAAWAYLEGFGDSLGLTVRELLDAEEVDYGDDE